MKPGTSPHLYRVRVRARLVQELFAVVGIAAGVALLFASQVASQSLSELGRAALARHRRQRQLQLLARDPHGMPEALRRPGARDPGRARRRAAARSERAARAARRAAASVELVGADSSLRQLGGALVRHTELEPFAGIGAVLLPAPLASRLGVTKFGREVTLQLYGRTAAGAAV